MNEDIVINLYDQQIILKKKSDIRKIEKISEAKTFNNFKSNPEGFSDFWVTEWEYHYGECMSSCKPLRRTDDVNTAYDNYKNGKGNPMSFYFYGYYTDKERFVKEALMKIGYNNISDNLWT